MIFGNEHPMAKHVGHCKEIEDSIFEKYRSKKKNFCQECRRKHRKQILNEHRPVSFFVVGEDFQKTDNHQKIMFVGKTVQGGWGKRTGDPIDKSGFIDARKYAREQLLVQFWGNSFMQCIKEICRILWKTDNLKLIWRKIAITNLVKCSTSESGDNTPDLLKRNCITKAKFFEEEVKRIKPTHVVLFTGYDYDDYLEEIGFEGTSKDPMELGNTGGIKSNVMRWDGELEKDGVKIRFLRTCHPSYFNRKNDSLKGCFCEAIAGWIEEPDHTSK
jgi:uracil-DNA glycosylase